MSASPTLSGAELGKCNPRREVPGGIWIEEGGALVNRPAWLRIVRERDGNASLDYARQLLTARGDGTFIPGQLSRWAMFFQLHFALIEPPQEGKPQALMFPIPPGLADEKGKLSIPAVWQLPLNDLADGQLDRLGDEYSILRQTETPAALTHKEWETLIAEGKQHSLETLVSRHGYSALIQLLHGLSKGARA